jgi:uncharacterized membrane protein YhaH (DUF805 family)
MLFEVTFLEIIAFNGRLSPREFCQRLVWIVGSAALLSVYFMFAWGLSPMLDITLLAFFAMQIYWCACLTRRLRDAAISLWPAKALLVGFLGYVTAFAVAGAKMLLTLMSAKALLAFPFVLLAASLLVSFAIWTRPSVAAPASS